MTFYVNHYADGDITAMIVHATQYVIVRPLAMACHIHSVHCTRVEYT